MAEMGICGDSNHLSIYGFEVINAITEGNDFGGTDKSAEEDTLSSMRSQDYLLTQVAGKEETTYKSRG